VGDANTVRPRYKRQLIQLNINKSGLYRLEWKTRDPFSVVNDPLIRAVPTIAVWNLKLFPNGLRVAASDWIHDASP